MEFIKKYFILQNVIVTPIINAFGEENSVGVKKLKTKTLFIYQLVDVQYIDMGFFVNSNVIVLQKCLHYVIIWIIVFVDIT